MASLTNRQEFEQSPGDSGGQRSLGVLQPVGSPRVKHNLGLLNNSNFYIKGFISRNWLMRLWGMVAGWQLRQELMAGFEAEFLLLQETSVFTVKAFQ